MITSLTVKKTHFHRKLSMLQCYHIFSVFVDTVRFYQKVITVSIRLNIIPLVQMLFPGYGLDVASCISVTIISFMEAT